MNICTNVQVFQNLLRDRKDVQVIECTENEACASGLWALEIAPGRCVVGADFSRVRQQTEQLRGVTLSQMITKIESGVI